MRPTTARPETKFRTSPELSNNPGGLKKGTGSSQSFNAVEAEGNDLVHSDGKRRKAIELLRKYKDMEKPFFLAVGFVRPHAFWWLRKIFRLTRLAKWRPAQDPGGSGRYPWNSGNRRTTANYQMDLNRRKARSGPTSSSFSCLEGSALGVIQRQHHCHLPCHGYHL